MINMRKSIFILVVLVIAISFFIFRSFLPGSQSVVPEVGTPTFHEELYQMRNPYIGDASANGRILQALFPADETGPFHMELETSERPYVLQVIFREIPEDPHRMDALLSRQGLLILALIDNADAVQMTYPLESGEAAVMSAVRVKKDDLYDALGVWEEDYELTPEVLDQLLNLK